MPPANFIALYVGFHYPQLTMHEILEESKAEKSCVWDSGLLTPYLPDKNLAEALLLGRIIAELLVLQKVKLHLCTKGWQ